VESFLVNGAAPLPVAARILSLTKLVERGAIDRNEARLRAPHPEEFDSIKT